MTTFTIFERTSSYKDARVRWHKLAEVEAASRSNALRNFIDQDEFVGGVAPTHIIDSRTDCVMVTDVLLENDRAADHLILAWPSDRIDFDHYDEVGNLVKATA